MDEDGALMDVFAFFKSAAARSSIVVAYVPSSSSSVKFSLRYLQSATRPCLAALRMIQG